jgi:hypothetical protein
MTILDERPDYTVSDQMVLIQLEAAITLLRRQLIARFQNAGLVSIDAGEQFVLVETPFSENIHFQSSSGGARADAVEFGRRPDEQATVCNGRRGEREFVERVLSQHLELTARLDHIGCSVLV